MGEVKTAEGSYIEVPGIPSDLGKVLARLAGRIPDETDELQLAPGSKPEDVFQFSTERVKKFINLPKIKVFLCHAKQDKQRVRKLYRHLLENGIETWLDEENILPGQDWDLEIKKAIRGCHIVAICLSKASVTKTGYVQKEIRFALDFADEQPDGSIYIIPVKLEECEVPPRLTRWHWVELYRKGGKGQLLQTLDMKKQRKR